MRTLMLGLLAIATAVTADTAVYSTGSLHHPAVKPTVITSSEYRFYDRFCRAQYNNATDRSACMMNAVGTTLSTIERDDR
jgi:hypothetical protein